MLATYQQLKDLFHCCNSVVTECRRIIKDNPERYGMYSIAGSLTDAAAFLDAYTFRKKIKGGFAIPEYDETAACRKVKQMLEVVA